MPRSARNCTSCGMSSVHLILDFFIPIYFIPPDQETNVFYFILLINDLFFAYSFLFHSDWPKNKYYLCYFINK